MARVIQDPARPCGARRARPSPTPGGSLGSVFRGGVAPSLPGVPVLTTGPRPPVLRVIVERNSFRFRSAAPWERGTDVLRWECNGMNSVLRDVDVPRSLDSGRKNRPQ